MEVMPTFTHPTGNRAHVMNVYTRSEYRRQGIGLHMVEMLIKEAKEKDITEIRDATKMGRALYKRCNFVEEGEYGVKLKID